MKAEPALRRPADEGSSVLVVDERGRLVNELLGMTVRPDRAQTAQRLGKVTGEGRAQEILQAFELTCGVAICESQFR